jgi:hypothetical protein
MGKEKWDGGVSHRKRRGGAAATGDGEVAGRIRHARQVSPGVIGGSDCKRTTWIGQRCHSAFGVPAIGRRLSQLQPAPQAPLRSEPRNQTGKTGPGVLHSNRAAKGGWKLLHYKYYK